MYIFSISYVFNTHTYFCVRRHKMVALLLLCCFVALLGSLACAPGNDDVDDDIIISTVGTLLLRVLALGCSLVSLWLDFMVNTPATNKQATNSTSSSTDTHTHTHSHTPIQSPYPYRETNHFHTQPTDESTIWLASSSSLVIWRRTTCIHTHTHTYKYIYLYICTVYVECRTEQRERGRAGQEREGRYNKCTCEWFFGSLFTMKQINLVRMKWEAWKLVAVVASCQVACIIIIVPASNFGYTSSSSSKPNSSSTEEEKKNELSLIRKGRKMTLIIQKKVLLDERANRQLNIQIHLYMYICTYYHANDKYIFL